MRHLVLGSIVAVAGLAGTASATVMTVNMTVDNAFDLYVSTNNAVPGTLVGSGSNWTATYTFTNIPLTPGVTNYIHVVASDFGAPAAFIGHFDLSDSGFEFANGSQHLVTTPAHWQLSLTGVGGPYEPGITSSGLNGVGPWGFRTGIDAGAEWLAFNGSSTNYFSTAVTPVPEPSVLGVLGVGAMLALRRKPR